MVKFLLIDRPLAYNTSMSHLKMKFPIEHGVEEVKGDQWVARHCYNITLKDVPRRTASGVKINEVEK
jgi:hypothetical protein